MESLEGKILNTIKTYQLIEKGDKIVLGVSGGPDSMCMLNSLINLCHIAKGCQRGRTFLATFTN